MYRHTNIYASQQPWLIILNKTFDFDTSDSFTINNTCIQALVVLSNDSTKVSTSKYIAKNLCSSTWIKLILVWIWFDLSYWQCIQFRNKIVYTTFRTPQIYSLILCMKWNTHLNSMYEKFINIWRKIFNFGFFFLNKKGTLIYWYVRGSTIRNSYVRSSKLESSTHENWRFGT